MPADLRARAEVYRWLLFIATELEHEAQLLDGFPRLRAYLERMYQRPKAPQHIAQAFASPSR